MSATPGPTWAVLNDIEPTSSVAPSEDELVPSSQDMRDEIDPTPPPGKRKLETSLTEDEIGHEAPSSSSTQNFIPKSPLPNPLTQTTKKRKKRKIIDNSGASPEFVRVPLPPLSKPPKNRDASLSKPPPATQIPIRGGAKSQTSARKRKNATANIFSSEDEAVIIPAKQVPASQPTPNVGSERRAGVNPDWTPMSAPKLPPIREKFSRDERVSQTQPAAPLPRPQPRPRPSLPASGSEATTSEQLPAVSSMEASSSTQPDASLSRPCLRPRLSLPVSRLEASGSDQLPVVSNKEPSASKHAPIVSNKYVSKKETSSVKDLPTASRKTASSSKHVSIVSSKGAASKDAPTVSSKDASMSSKQNTKRRRSPGSSSDDDLPENLSRMRDKHKRRRTRSSVAALTTISRIPSSSQPVRGRPKVGSVSAKIKTQPRQRAPPRSAISATQAPDRRKSAISKDDFIELFDDEQPTPSKRVRRSSGFQSPADIIVIMDSDDEQPPSPHPPASQNLSTNWRASSIQYNVDADGAIVLIDSDDDEVPNKTSFENPKAGTHVEHQEDHSHDAPSLDEPPVEPIGDADDHQADEPTDEQLGGAEVHRQPDDIQSSLNRDNAPPLDEPTVVPIDDAGGHRIESQGFVDHFAAPLDEPVVGVDEVPEADAHLSDSDNVSSGVDGQVTDDVRQESTEPGSYSDTSVPLHSKSVGSARSASAETSAVQGRLQDLNLDSDHGHSVHSEDAAAVKVMDARTSSSLGDTQVGLPVTDEVLNPEGPEASREDIAGFSEPAAKSDDCNIPIILAQASDRELNAVPNTTGGYAESKMQLEQPIVAQSAPSGLRIRKEDVTMQISGSINTGTKKTQRTVVLSTKSPSLPHPVQKLRALYGGPNGFFKDIFKQQVKSRSSSTSVVESNSAVKTPVVDDSSAQISSPRAFISAPDKDKVATSIYAGPANMSHTFTMPPQSEVSSIVTESLDADSSGASCVQQVLDHRSQGPLLNATPESLKDVQKLPPAETGSVVSDPDEATLTYAMNRVHVASSSPASASGETQPDIQSLKDALTGHALKTEEEDRITPASQHIPRTHTSPETTQRSKGQSLTEVINIAYYSNVRGSKTVSSDRPIIDLTSDPTEEEVVTTPTQSLQTDNIAPNELSTNAIIHSQRLDDTVVPPLKNSDHSSLPEPSLSPRPALVQPQQVKSRLGLDEIRNIRSRLVSRQLSATGISVDKGHWQESTGLSVPAKVEISTQFSLSDVNPVSYPDTGGTLPNLERLSASLLPSNSSPAMQDSFSSAVHAVGTRQFPVTADTNPPEQVMGHLEEPDGAEAVRTDEQCMLTVNDLPQEEGAPIEIPLGEQSNNSTLPRSQREDDEERECLQILTYPDSSVILDTSDVEMSDERASIASTSREKRSAPSSASSETSIAQRRPRRLVRRSPSSSSSSSLGPVEPLDDIPTLAEACIRIRRNGSDGFEDPQAISGSSLSECGFELLTWEKDHARMMAKEFADMCKLAKDMPHEIQDRLNAMSLAARRADDMQVKLFEAFISENTYADEPFAPPIHIINNMDDELTPPCEFHYSNLMWHSEGVPKPDFKNLKGCGCQGPCDPTSKTCSCLQRQREYYPSDHGFIYDSKGVLRQHDYPIFECNDLCGCSSECKNRVVQHGRRYAVNIQKTSNKGWGVFAGPKKIPKHTFIGIYAGEYLTDAEGESRGGTYNKFGRTYLFDLDFHHLQQGDPDWQTKYCVDAYHAGNFTRYLNHSCDPNCNINACYINEANLDKPLLTIFTCRDVQAGDELCFSYFGNPDSDVEDGEDDDAEGDSQNVNDGVYVRCRCGTSKCKGKMWK